MKYRSRSNMDNCIQEVMLRCMHVPSMTVVWKIMKNWPAPKILTSLDREIQVDVKYRYLRSKGNAKMYACVTYHCCGTNSYWETGLNREEKLNKVNGLWNMVKYGWLHSRGRAKMYANTKYHCCRIKSYYKTGLNGKQVAQEGNNRSPEQELAYGMNIIRISNDHLRLFFSIGLILCAHSKHNHLLCLNSAGT